MKTKINVANTKAIQSVIDAVNGKATAHVFTTAKEIVEITNRLEKKLVALKLPKKDWKGARFVAYSGDSVANTYGYGRIGNAATIEIGSNGNFFLVDFVQVRLYSVPFSDQLYLSLKQDQSIINHVRKAYLLEVSEPALV